MASLVCPLVKTDQLVCEEVLGECVIYDGHQKKVHHLNSTLTWIWNRCDGKTSIDAMATAFEQEFETTNSKEILLNGLRQLNEHGLLETPIESSVGILAEKAAVGRRSVVGGAILMPLIVSLLAPTPAAAKSPSAKPPKPPKPPKGRK